MRFLTPAEVEERFGTAGFSVPAADGSGRERPVRTRLDLDIQTHGRQSRIGGRPPGDAGNLLYFGRALNLWLSDEGGRMLWIDRWEPGPYRADDALIAAARLGLGEKRPLAAAPGHYVDSYPWHIEDQDKVSAAQARDLSLLSGLLVLVMATGSDAWLIAEGGTDRIEFWEGNLFFYSNQPTKIDDANALMRGFNCPRDLR